MNRRMGLGLCVGLVAGLCLGSARGDEPVNDGKKLSEWVKLLKSRDAKERARAAEAIGEMKEDAKGSVGQLLPLMAVAASCLVGVTLAGCSKTNGNPTAAGATSNKSPAASASPQAGGKSAAKPAEPAAEKPPARLAGWVAACQQGGEMVTVPAILSDQLTN